MAEIGDVHEQQNEKQISFDLRRKSSLSGNITNVVDGARDSTISLSQDNVDNIKQGAVTPTTFKLDFSQRASGFTHFEAVLKKRYQYSKRGMFISLSKYPCIDINIFIRAR